MAMNILVLLANGEKICLKVTPETTGAELK